MTFKNLAKKAGIELRLFKPSDGESWHNVMERAQSFLLEVTDSLMPHT
jgi:broad specificity phosphatase PhoE